MNIDKIMNELQSMKKCMDRIVVELGVPGNGSLPKPENPNLLTDDDVMPFGKYAGYKLKELPPDYVDWMMQQEKMKHVGLNSWLTNKKNKGKGVQIPFA